MKGRILEFPDGEKLVIGPDDAVIVLKADGSTVIATPQRDDDDDIPLDSPEWRAVVIASFMDKEEIFQMASQRLAEPFLAENEDD